MTIDQVMSETGYSTKAELLQEYLDNHIDYYSAANPMSGDEQETAELRDLAWQLYQGLLAEEPEYLPQIVEILRQKRKKENLAFANIWKARHRPSVNNVLEFRPR